MRKIYIPIVLAAAALAACTRDVEPELPAGELMVVKASFEDPDTRTSLSVDGAGSRADVMWNSGDQINLLAFTGSSVYYNYFSTSDDGVPVAEFSCHNWKPVTEAQYAAVYPADKYKGYEYSAADGYTFGMVIPPVQTAVKGGVERGLLRSFATAGSSVSSNLTFRNAIALLRFRIGGSAASRVCKVKLFAGAEIAGDCLAVISNSGEFSYITNKWFMPLEYGQSNSVELQGTFEPGEDYHFATIPCESDGFSLIFYDASDRIISRHSYKTLKLTRSRITDIGTVQLNGEFGAANPDVVTYMKHSKGSVPVCLAVVAEGFTASEQDKFVTLAKSAVDVLFGTEPYKTYKDYFNVYLIKAVSNESGASVTDGNGNIVTKRDTRFGARWGSSVYYDMESDQPKVWGYVSARCPEILKGQLTIDQVAVALIINDSRYGGRCTVTSSGRSVAHVPYTSSGGPITWEFPDIIANDDITLDGAHYTTAADRNEVGRSHGDWRNTFLHEFGGHGFGRLLDEYWDGPSYSTGTTIVQHGWSVPYGLNVSGVYNSVPWQADLLDNLDALVARDSRYSRIGRFQGGDEMVLNRWRCEKISCMIDNRQYFSAWQRELIVKRIMELSGSSFSLSDFIASDVTFDPVRDGSVGSASVATMASALKCPPLAPPQFIDYSTGAGKPQPVLK